MVLFWFILALVLLVAAIVLLRLDAKQRRGNSDGGDGSAAPDRGSGDGSGDGVGGGVIDDDDTTDPHSPEPADRDGDTAHDDPGAPKLAPFQRTSAPGGDSAGGDTGGGDTVADDPAPAEPAPAASDAADPAPIDPAEPTAESSPRLLDKVRGLMPARRQTGRTPEPAEQTPVDPLAGSPVVQWLEDRAFEPTPTPAPEFRHGDFALGLSSLGTVSHGVFRGRRALMGVTGGRTVLAMRRDTASDVVLDLSRSDVDSEPGLYDAGEVGTLEARTSDRDRLDLIDRDRLVHAVSEVPTDVRRIWVEAEWIASTVDGVDDPSTWDDVVAALHEAADVVAPLPPIGGRARALPAEIDPGAPGAAAGPDADPTVGMDGETGTGTQAAPTPNLTPTPEPTSAGADEPDEADAQTVPTEATAPTETDAPTPRRAGHLRLVPDRTPGRDLTDKPVVADRGDVVEESQTEETQTEETQPEADTAPDPAPEPERDPFAEIMEPTSAPSSRGDVASDHLEPRPPLSRPTRGAGQAYPEDASVPPLAAGAGTGSSGIKPLGSEDDQDEIRDEVERFDAARIDGGSDLDSTASGRHGAAGDQDDPEATGRLSVAELAARMGATPSTGGRRRRRAESDTEESDTAEPEETATGRERPGIDPDVEQTARLRLPPDIRD